MQRINIDREWQFTPQALDFYSFIVPVERVVNLPHDFTIESEVSPDAPGGKNTGFYKGGIAS